MAHWAELDDNNIVLRVTVGDNNDPNGDEGYQWIIDNLGGRWVKTSYNTIKGVHLNGGTPFRGTYAGVGFTYDEETDRFLPPKDYPTWVFDEASYSWIPPKPKLDTGLWTWNEELQEWEETEVAYR